MSPIYDFRCSNQNCQFSTDILCSAIGPTPTPSCPLCGADLVKVPSIPSPPTGCPTPRFYPDRW